MKRKTITTLIMSAILAAAMAAGCGNQGETAGSTGSQTDTVAKGTESE